MLSGRGDCPPTRRPGPGAQVSLAEDEVGNGAELGEVGRLELSADLHVVPCLQAH